VIRATSFFPDPDTADPTGLVAISHAMNPGLLIDAYSHGIFPWSENPVCWYSPDPRALFVRDRIKLPKKMGKAMRRHQLHVTFDESFEQVMTACAEAHARTGTWISPPFLRAYAELHRMGHAHSVEVWQENRLVGGLYGVQIGAMFAGESMFHLVTNASKVAFVHLVEQLQRIGVILFDAQVINAFTIQLGAVLVRRAQFLEVLKHAVSMRTSVDGQRWPAEPPPLAAAS
jgi:leucyl/phenylalanyl-tRNA--protein transferase